MTSHSNLALIRKKERKTIFFCLSFLQLNAREQVNHHLSINRCRDVDYDYFSKQMIKQVTLQVVLAHVNAVREVERHMCIHRRVKCLHARNRTSDLDLLNARRSFCSRKKTTTRTICLLKTANQSENSFDLLLRVFLEGFASFSGERIIVMFRCSILCDKCLLDI